MDLQEIIQLQNDFDKKHSSKFEWSMKITDENLETLEFLILALTGELGELANVVKKVVRGDFPLASGIPHMEEEITDLFIYLIKVCYQLNINLEDSFLKKLDQNKINFKRYEK